MLPWGAIADAPAATLNALAAAASALRAPPEVRAAKVARRLGHDAWSLAKHDGRLARAQDRLERIIARGGWRARIAASHLAQVNQEIKRLHEIIEIHNAFMLK